MWLLPALGLLVPLACSPALGDGFELPKLFLLKLGLVLVLLTTGASVAFGQPRSGIAMAAALAVACFLAVNALATLVSIEPRTALLGAYDDDQGLFTLGVEVAYFFLAAAWIRTEAALARFAAGVTIAAVAASVYAVGQAVGIDPLGWSAVLDDVPRQLTSTLGHPNSLGEFLALGLPLTVWLGWRGRGVARDLCLWSLIPQVVALGLAQARIAWVAVGFELLLVVPLVACLRGSEQAPLRWLGRAVALVPLAGMSVAFLGLLLVPSTAQLGEAAAPGGPRGVTLQTRQELWHSALAMIGDRPLLGWGPDTFALVYPAYRSSQLDALEDVVGRDDTAHTLLLGIGANAGLLGMAAFGAVQVAILLLLLRGAFVRPGHPGTAGRMSLLALLVVSTTYLILFLFGRQRVTTDWLAWVVAGAAVGFVSSHVARPRRLPGVARVGLAALGVVLLGEAGSGLAAEVAVGRATDSQATLSPVEAIAWLQQGVALRPFEPSYHEELGRQQHSLAADSQDALLFQAAIEQLSIASTLSGERDAYVLSRLARASLGLQLAGGRPAHAPLTYSQRALDLDPRNPLLHATASELAARQGDIDLARAQWATARTLAHSPDAFQRVGEVAMQYLGDPLGARAAFRDAVALQWRTSGQAGLYRQWGEAAQAAGLSDDAALAFAQVLARDPTDDAVRLERAEALASGGRRAEALLQAQRVLDQTPTDEHAAELVQRLRQP
jgi:O-antigen ligase/tetratricopeptide (TPR) repeat protein